MRDGLLAAPQPFGEAGPLAPKPLVRRRINVTVAEPHRHVIDQFRHLKTFQLPVAAMQRNQFFRLIH
jgi:hypothetical protein